MDPSLPATNNIRTATGDKVLQAQLTVQGSWHSAMSRIMASFKITGPQTSYDQILNEVSKVLAEQSQESAEATKSLTIGQRAVFFHSCDQAFEFLHQYLSELGCSNVYSYLTVFLDRNAEKRADPGFKIRASGFSLLRSVCVGTHAVPSAEDKEFTALLAHEMTHAVSNVEFGTQGGQFIVLKQGLQEFGYQSDLRLAYGSGLSEAAGRLMGRRYLLDNGYTELDRIDRLVFSKSGAESQSFEALSKLCTEAEMDGCKVEANRIEIPMTIRVQVFEGKVTFGGMPSEAYVSSLLRLSHRVFPHLSERAAERKFEELIIKSDYEGTLSVVNSLISDTVGHPTSLLVSLGVYYHVAHRIALTAYVEGILNGKDSLRLFFAALNFIEAYNTDGVETSSNEYFASDVRYKNSRWSAPLYQSNSMGNIKTKASELTTVWA